jgi:phosphoribosylformimino-5-aminoimidazole carboxamide ribotide isomerase
LAKGALSHLRIIPVMDLLDGSVVHAKRGERNKYQPIRSVLSSSAEPVEVAKTLYKEFKFKELYVADLDAIQGKNMTLEDVRRVSKATPMHVMVDAGVNNIEAARAAEKAGASKIIVATETLEDLNTIPEIAKDIGSDRIILSLDLKQGRILSRSAQLAALSAVKAAETLEELGASQLIVLELARVGSELGIDRPLVQSIVDNVKMPVLAGGGVRNINDLVELNDMGVSGALVATSLHAGSITKNDLHSLVS